MKNTRGFEYGPGRHGSSFFSPSHDFRIGDVVFLEGLLPIGIARDVGYWVVVVDGDEFQLATWPDGPEIWCTTPGHGRIALARDQE